MALSTRDLRRKIKSVGQTAKITRAMQMVAASKMQRAIKKASEARPYSEGGWELIERLGRALALGQEASHPLLQPRPIGRTTLVLVTSNRGLCGAFNNQLFREVNRYLSEYKNQPVNLVTLGAKGRSYVLNYHKEKLLADFPEADVVIDFNSVRQVGELLMGQFLSGQTDEVIIFYNHFVSTLRQIPTAKKILPIAPSQEAETSRGQTEYLFEPTAEVVLGFILPLLIKSQIYQIILESNASEHSARMLAMQSATDNAGGLLDDLTLTYNAIRQANITKEIAEISGAAEALQA